MKSERTKYPGSDTWTERTLSLPQYFSFYFSLSHYLSLLLCLIFAHFPLFWWYFSLFFSCCDMCGSDWKRGGRKERQREKNDATESTKDQRVREGWASKRRFNDETWRNVVFFLNERTYPFLSSLRVNFSLNLTFSPNQKFLLEPLLSSPHFPLISISFPFIHSLSDSKNCGSGSCHWNYSVLR